MTIAISPVAFPAAHCACGVSGHGKRHLGLTPQQPLSWATYAAEGLERTRVKTCPPFPRVLSRLPVFSGSPVIPFRYFLWKQQSLTVTPWAFSLHVNFMNRLYFLWRELNY